VIKSSKQLEAERLAKLRAAEHGPEVTVVDSFAFREATIVLLLQSGVKFGVLVENDGTVTADDITEMAYWQARRTGKVCVMRS
jgi:hypothetical protein